MWPTGHLAFAYLSYRGYLWRREATSIPDLPVVALGVGALLPDLVDKPLAWTLALLPSGRSLAHSLFTALALGVALYVLARGTRYLVVAGALYLGHLSHLLGDALPGVLMGYVSAAYFLNWPLGPHPVYEQDSSFVAHFEGLWETLGQMAQGNLASAGFLPVEMGLVVVAGVLWVVDGTPGLGWVRRRE